jgi:LmbE family N-acetylglucosaminyl deacetylase
MFIIGIDPHKGSHTAVAVDSSEAVLDTIHAKIRDATLAAVARSTWRPARTYLWCVPQSLMQRFAGHPGIGTADSDITTIVDTRAVLDVRWRAMRAHASQVVPFDAMTPDLRDAFLSADHLRRVDPPWTGGPLEHTWIP